MKLDKLPSTKAILTRQTRHKKPHNRESTMRARSAVHPVRAEAPDMISMSSVVIDAWRVLEEKSNDKGLVSIHLLYTFFVSMRKCVSTHVRKKKGGRKKPVISKGKAIEHFASISTGVVHGRHTRSQLAACILQHRVKQNLRWYVCMYLQMLVSVYVCIRTDDACTYVHIHVCLNLNASLRASIMFTG